jgi:hypothetical protein
VLELSVSRRLFGVAVRLCWNIPSVDGFFGVAVGRCWNFPSVDGFFQNR